MSTLKAGAAQTNITPPLGAYLASSSVGWVERLKSEFLSTTIEMPPVNNPIL